MMNNKIRNSLIAKKFDNFIGMEKIMVMVAIDILMVTGHLCKEAHKKL